MDGSPDLSQAKHVFHGPRHLDTTAMKYIHPFKDTVESDGGAKYPRLPRATSHVRPRTGRHSSVYLRAKDEQLTLRGTV